MASSFYSDPSGKTYFDLDGDEELRQSSSSDNGPLLTWRGDPVETLSDWTIMVVTNELQTLTYHVHKSVLCFGSRQSKYFSRIMTSSTPQKHRKPNSGVHCTKVELDQADAENIPIILDYIYTPGPVHSSSGTVVTAASTLTSPSLLPSTTIDSDCSQSQYGSTGGCTSSNASVAGGVEGICSDNAVSIRFLARLFEVDSLTIAVNKFIQRDLSFETGLSYLLKASEYKDERLLESAKRLCADNFEHLDTASLQRLPLHLFRVMVKALESYDDENRNLSLFLSDNVCRYFEKHSDVLCAELLVEFTDPLIMPYVTSEAAIGITALIKELNPSDAMSYWPSLVSLSRRCATSVVQEYGWNDFSVNAAVDEYLKCNNNNSSSRDPLGSGNSVSSASTQQSHEHVSRVDSLLFATSFAAALEQAQDDYEDITVEQQRLEETVELLKQTIDTLEKTHQMKDDYMAKQQKVVEEAKRQIVHLKQQLGNNKRNHQQRRQPNNPLIPQLGSASLEQASPIHDSRPRNYHHNNISSSSNNSNLSADSHNQSIYKAQPGAFSAADLPIMRSPPIKELVSPSQVGRSVHANKRKARALMTKEEMRSRSLLL